MPYSYRSRYRRTYRSKSKRYRRTFSRYNTYRNRSSIAQANQIYKLNRRITRIESNTKPEYLEFNNVPDGTQILTPVSLNQWQQLTISHVTDLASSTFFGGLMKDTTARVLKVIVWGALERNPAILPQDVVTHDAAMSCCYVRLAVIQYQAEKYADISVADIFDMEHGPLGYYHPLKRGCGSHGRILKVFNIKISSQDPVTKNFKFVIKPKYKIVRKSLDENGEAVTNQRMKGGIVILPIGYVENNEITYPDTFHFSLTTKVIYTDA